MAKSQRSRMARLELVLGTLLPLVLTAACESSSSGAFVMPASPAPLTTATAQDITFSYPSAWSRTQWDEQGSFTKMVAAVSNRAVKTPCTHFPSGWSCGQPVDQMQSATLLVEWWQSAFPNWTLEAQAGSAITVDGLRGKLQDPADLKTVCPNIAAESGLQVLIERADAPANYFAFVACFKGPGVAAERTEALAILSTVRLKR